MNDVELYNLADKITKAHLKGKSDVSDYEDIRQEVAIALWKANARWRRDGGASLRTYLWDYGRWAIKEYLRRRHEFFDHHRRDERHYDVEITEALHLQGSAGVNADDWRSNAGIVLHNESPRNRAIIYECLVLERPEKKVAEDYGVTETTLCKVLSKFRERALRLDRLQCLPVQQMAFQLKKRPTTSESPFKQSKPIRNTLFRDSVPET